MTSLVGMRKDEYTFAYQFWVELPELFLVGCERVSVITNSPIRKEKLEYGPKANNLSSKLQFREDFAKLISDVFSKMEEPFVCAALVLVQVLLPFS